MFSQSREKQISPKEFRGLGGLGPSAQGSRMSFHSSGTGRILSILMINFSFYIYE